LRILKKFSKLAQQELGEKYGIRPTTVSDIVKKEGLFFIHHYYTDNYAGNKKRFTFSPKYADLNDLLLKWLKQVRGKKCT
jgi:hypothetical protein